MQAADVLVLVAVAAHTAVHVPILSNHMRPLPFDTTP
jgi:hypothetical protein